MIRSLRIRGRRCVITGLVTLCAASLVGTAEAARRTQEIDLTQVIAKAEVHDSVVRGEREPPKAPPSRIEQFVDSHGHTFRVGTDIPALDLLPYANVLASTVHRGETADVLVEVVLRAQVAPICGSPDAEACYYADLDNPGHGWMYIPNDHPDLGHIIVHEYGHHVDHQLLNLAHFAPCYLLGDGSRNWMVARNPGAFSCQSSRWDEDLAELYAEDYVVLNGIDDWFLTTMSPPNQSQLRALAFDFFNPFWPRRLFKSRFVRWDGVLRKRFTVRHWTVLSMTLSGRRAADLDLYLFRQGRRRAIAKSTRVGSRETVRRILRPGTYMGVVHAYGANGTARLRIDLF